MRRKFRVKLIVTLSIIVVILIAGVVLFFTTDIFRTKRSAFFRYFNQIPDVLNVVKTNKYEEYFKKKESSPYTRKAQISIQNSSNVADSNILDKVKFEINEKSDAENEKANLDFSVLNENNNLFRVSAIRNKKQFGIFSSDIMNKYVTANNNDLKRIASDFGVTNVAIFPNEIRNVQISNILETSKRENTHIKECVDIIKNKVPQTAYNKNGKEKVVIKEKGYGAQSYKLSLSASDNSNLQVELLEKISKDSILMDYITSKFKYFNLDEKYCSINSLNDLMKKKIEDLKKNPEEAGRLEIIVYEYKQKNIKTEIINENNKIVIEHLKNDDNNEISAITINNKKIETNLIDGKYVYAYENLDENNKERIEVEYNQAGNVSENNVQNIMTINYTKGIKKITYLYNDSVEFKDDIGKIQDFTNKDLVVLNDYGDDEIKQFAKEVKQKINEIYVKKGASIGINLDPIFNEN